MTGPVSGLEALRHIEAARAQGIPWEDLIGDQALPPTDPDQHRSARSYLQFRSGREPAADPETVERGARILLAGPDASLTERALGLRPGEVDYGDVAEVLDREAARIHRPGELTLPSAGGRHEAPFVLRAGHEGQGEAAGER